MVSLTVALEKKGIPPLALKSSWYQRLANLTRKAGYTLPIVLSIALVDDPTIRRINKQTRRVDRVTDVLSFSYGLDEGELIIAPNQARRQYASFKSKSLKDELKRLVIHGYLHLAGLDHKKLAERRIMEQVTRTLLLAAKKI
ncbi:MAG: rRNA maturation RNase YbeY [Patescibacteria group bacterium]